MFWSYNDTKRASIFNTIYFYFQAFEWFQDLLATLEDENIDGFLEIQTYLTAGLKADEMRNIILNDIQGTSDAITGLRSPTYYGRPNFDQIFKGMRSSHPNTDIGVFFCGPKALSTTIHKACDRWTETTENGTRFFYGKGMYYVILPNVLFNIFDLLRKLLNSFVKYLFIIN